MGGTYGPTFTIPVPTSLTGWVSGVAPDLTLTQTGSRLMYIDPVGGVEVTNTATARAQLMFWNGANIVDASGFTSPGGVGTLYGTDPLSPSGTVNTFKRWASVGARSDASDIGSISGSVGAVNSAPSGWTRAGLADWYLIKRGTTLDLTADRTAWIAAAGGAQVVGGLNLPRGKSISERVVCAAYGSTAVARPTITKPPTQFLGAFVASLNFALWTGLKLDGNDRTAGVTMAQYLIANAADTDVNFEDCWFFRGGSNFSVSGTHSAPESGGASEMAGGFTFRGNLFTDCWLPSNGANGIFFSGSSTSRLNLYSNIFMRNGFHRDPTQRTSFVPDGVEVIPGETISTITGNGATVTVVTLTPHSLTVGASITVSGATGGTGTFNGTFTCATASGSTYTYTATGNGSPTGASYTCLWAFMATGFAQGNRNLYSSGIKDINNSFTSDNVFIQGISGVQDRGGSNWDGNFLYEGYAAFAATNGASYPSVATTGRFLDNVLQRYAPPAITNGTTPCPGWGFLVGGGLYGTEVARNIYTTAQYPNNGTSTGFGLNLRCIYNDAVKTFHRATTNLNIHDNILDVIFNDVTTTSGIWEEDGDEAQQDNQWAVPLTGTWGTAGNVITCTPVAGYSGSPAYQWYKNGVVIAGEVNPTYTLVAGDLSANNDGIRCRVTGISYAGVLGVGLSGNTVQNNVVTNATAVKRFSSSSINMTPTNSSNTAYTTNRLYTTTAAAKSTESWLDETRTLKTYLVSLGKVVTTADGAQEYYNLVTAMQRGNMDTNVWSGKKINNHIRAGRTSASLPLPPLT